VYFCITFIYILKYYVHDDKTLFTLFLRKKLLIYIFIASENRKK